MKNILLTGSGGFIGKHLKKYFTEYNLYAPRSYELNLLDEGAVVSYLAKNKIEFIVHSASCGVRITPDATIENVAKPNIEMFDNLVKHMSDCCKMIVLGSGAEYDKSKPIVNVKEDDFEKSVPQDPYGYSKYVISKKINDCENILNLRVFGVYGEGENPSRVTSCILNDIIQQKPIELNQNVRFSFIYIDDLCKIIEYFVKNFPNEKFINAVQPDAITIKELAELANKVNSGNSSISFKQEGMNKEYTGCNRKLLQLLKNFEFTSYEKGMRDFYEVLKNES